MFVEHKEAGEVKELDAASKLLLKAAALLEEQGWCQHALEKDGAHCVMGALHHADHGDVDLKTDGSEIYWEARTRVKNSLGGCWVKWNNQEGRTADEVIAKLRTVAFSS